ncbi:hypothetical protein TNIN_474591 [Trichonephila inaurata madagascariensis]|uniref:Uncharacterized protein n=1 Tax=Trichonephila inaurata madagascariensis TaxID=2747483 RepID=A0A8X6XN73_9ARAC|nr:hypothetical protein TNIN_474591 [Trichonephila inaurata madagascariensis]
MTKGCVEIDLVSLHNPNSPRLPDLHYFIKAESFSADVTNTGKNDQRVWSLDCGFLRSNVQSSGDREPLGSRVNILGNQTAALLQGIEENCSSDVGNVNTVVTRSQTLQSKENEIFNESDQTDEQTELNLEEGTDNLENEEILPPVDC